MARSMFDQVLIGVGVLVMSYLTFKLLDIVYLYTLQPCKLDKYHHGKKGQAWALVTGASDGIGLGLAHALSEAGFNIILHGRNPDKLSSVESSLRSLYPSTDYRIFISDCTRTDTITSSISTFTSSLSSLPGPLTILINNAGGTPSRPRFQPVADSSAADFDATLDLNVRFAAQLTRALLPTLQAAAPALVINISSFCGLVGMPYLGSYCGSKAFLSTWTASVAREMQLAGTDVQAMNLVVGEVTGSVYNKGQATWGMPAAGEFARACLDRVGCGRVECVPWWPHWVQLALMMAMPEGVRGRVVRRLMEEQKAAEAKGS